MISMPRDFHPRGTVRPLGLIGVWDLPMTAPKILGVSELECCGVRVGETLIERETREPYFSFIVRAACLCGTDQPFVLLYADT